METRQKALIELYQDFMDRMAEDIHITHNFKEPLTDDYLEGIHSGITAAEDIFRMCFDQASKK
jgi:hypothetical protein